MGVRMRASEMGMGTAPTVMPAAVEAAMMLRATARRRLSEKSAMSLPAAWTPSGRSSLVASMSSGMPDGATKVVSLSW